MNILYLAHRIPYPPNKGDKLRSYRQLAHLAKSHRVRCAFFVDDPADARYVEKIRFLCDDVHAVRLNRRTALARGVAGLLAGGTLTESYYAHRAMWRGLRDWAASTPFDVVVAFSSSMAPYALSIPARRRVLDMCDVDSCKWQNYAGSSAIPLRWLYDLEARRLAAREREWSGRFDASLVISEAELRRLPAGCDRPRVHVIGNGVDIPLLPVSTAAPAPPVVGFVGVMNYRPNVDAVSWFARQCWPAIRQAAPAAVFRIVGRSPTRKVRRLARLPGVEVVGEVDDVGRELQRFTVSVAPLRIARGLQNKVLEAMAAALPVVLTTAAAEGIGAADGVDYLIADRPVELADTVARLLWNGDEGRLIGASARRFVRRNHRWESVLTQFELLVAGSASPTAMHQATVSRAASSDQQTVIPPTPPGSVTLPAG